MPTEFYAHSLPGEPKEKWQKLEEHSVGWNFLVATAAVHVGLDQRRTA